MSNQYSTQDLDHLGIVAGVCQQIGLIEQIDDRVPDTGRKVSVGQAVQAMVLNGLGFVGRVLYLTPEFYQTKPLDLLIGEGIEADELNSDSLGKALDQLHETIPDQKGKPTQRPTMRRVFQMFEGIHVLTIWLSERRQRLVTNVQAVHLQIATLLGEPILKFYTFEEIPF